MLEITKEDVPLSVFDTRGLEMADFTTTLKALRSFVSDDDGTEPARVSAIFVCLVLAGKMRDCALRSHRPRRCGPTRDSSPDTRGSRSTPFRNTQSHEVGTCSKITIDVSRRYCYLPCSIVNSCGFAPRANRYTPQRGAPMARVRVVAAICQLALGNLTSFSRNFTSTR
jgi:hypothetical protein